MASDTGHIPGATVCGCIHHTADRAGRTVNRSRPELDVGQLSDDIRELANMFGGPVDGEISVWNDLVHIIGILQRLASRDLPQP
jgi:hypothetical protein